MTSPKGTLVKHEGVLILSFTNTQTTDTIDSVNYTKSVLEKAGINFTKLDEGITKKFIAESCNKTKMMLAECRLEKQLRERHLIFALFVTFITIMIVFYKFITILLRFLKVSKH